MRRWASLTSRLPWNAARSKAAQELLTKAYLNVFITGNSSREDRETVLADMANAASWRKVCPPSVSNSELRYIEGARSLFSRVFAFTSLNDGDIRALEEAARYEAAADEAFTG